MFQPGDRVVCTSTIHGKHYIGVSGEVVKDMESYVTVKMDKEVFDIPAFSGNSVLSGPWNFYKRAYTLELESPLAGDPEDWS